MSSSPLIAIGLDAADCRQLEKWMDGGELPTLAAIRSRGTYAHLKGAEYFTAETPWTNFLTGVSPDKSGYWGTFQYDPRSYHVKEETVACYDFKEYKPFYALTGKKAAIFDVPQTQIVPDMKGLQVIAWGAHSPLSPPASSPEGLLKEIEEKYGKHPGLLADDCDWWRREDYPAHKQKMITGIERRGEICRDLLKREPWDFFYTVFGETHATGHDFYFTSRTDHPLSKYRKEIGIPEDVGLMIAKKIDEAIGTILSAAPADARVVIFSPHGMRANQNDLLSLVLLPEMIHRLHFSGTGFFQNSALSAPVGPMILRPEKRNWSGEIWRLKKEKSILKTVLKRILPLRYLMKLDERLKNRTGNTFYIPYGIYGYAAWQPSLWYGSLWPKMRFFALPNFGESLIRVNIRGRDARGIVDPEDYEKVCGEIEVFLGQLRSGRTGSPMLKKVIRTRKDALDPNPKLPSADLVVLWNYEVTDVIDHPELGRIGPLPFHRSGGHIPLGFFIAAGPGIQTKRTSTVEEAIHLTSTFLHHLGCAVPEYMDAKKVLF